jgi:hypothetical protein
MDCRQLDLEIPVVPEHKCWSRPRYPCPAWIGTRELVVFHRRALQYQSTIGCRCCDIFSYNPSSPWVSAKFFSNRSIVRFFDHFPTFVLYLRYQGNMWLRKSSNSYQCCQGRPR